MRAQVKLEAEMPDWIFCCKEHKERLSKCYGDLIEIGPISKGRTKCVTCGTVKEGFTAEVLDAGNDKAFVHVEILHLDEGAAN